MFLGGAGVGLIFSCLFSYIAEFLKVGAQPGLQACIPGDGMEILPVTWNSISFPKPEHIV